MRKFTTFLAASVVALGVGGSVASAQDDPDYPPGDDVVLLLSSSVVEPGEEFTATLEGCTAGETVDLSVDGDAATAECTNPQASATLTAPSAEGTYVVTGTGQSSGATASAELVVQSDDDDDFELPATGSDTSTTGMQIGALLLVGGLGLVAVARLRRRAVSA